MMTNHPSSPITGPMTLKFTSGLVLGERGTDPTVRKIARDYYAEGVKEIIDALRARFCLR